MQNMVLATSFGHNSTKHRKGLKMQDDMLNAFRKIAYNKTGSANLTMPRSVLRKLVDEIDRLREEKK